MSKVIPFDHEQDPSGTHIAELMEDPRTQLIDCRFNPFSWRSQWQKDALIKQWRERYHWAGTYLLPDERTCAQVLHSVDNPDTKRNSRLVRHDYGCFSLYCKARGFLLLPRDCYNSNTLFRMHSLFCATIVAQKGKNDYRIGSRSHASFCEKGAGYLRDIAIITQR